jgi:hypothetical protein
MTGLTADLAETECIDHMYISSGILPGAVKVEKAPTNPFLKTEKEPPSSDPAKIVGASDHVWFKVNLSPAQMPEGGVCN